MVSLDARKQYADGICAAANIDSDALRRAFAAVAREDYVGPAPWTILSPPAAGQWQPKITQVSDPGELYQDVAVFLDASKTLTNGNPSTLAPWLNALNLAGGKSAFHLGCGTGYYTAIIAEAVGPDGQVMASEVDPALAVQAERNLSQYPNVQVIEGDGSSLDIGPRDAILINAGVTHPTEHWPKSLTVGGNLVIPMTVEIGVPHVGKGLVLCIRRVALGYEARFLPAPVMIYSCTSARDPQIGKALGERFMSGTTDSVRSLRLEPHSHESSCWLHSTTFCLSTQPVAE
jgi:protein-L-isoaspartate(D-aspartate) O-methyltransferase